MFVKIVSPSVEALIHIVCQLSDFGTPSMSIVNEKRLAQRSVNDFASIPNRL